MRPPKYPLEPLRAFRDKKADEAAREVAVATHERDAAARERRRSEERLNAHTASAERVRLVERTALAQGELQVADLARAEDWETQIAAQRKGLALELSRAHVHEAGASAREEGARRLAASSIAEAQVVAKDRARWHDAQRKRTEEKEEEASSEAWRPIKS